MVVEAVQGEGEGGGADGRNEGQRVKRAPQDFALWKKVLEEDNDHNDTGITGSSGSSSSSSISSSNGGGGCGGSGAVNHWRSPWGAGRPGR